MTMEEEEEEEKLLSTIASFEPNGDAAPMTTDSYSDSDSDATDQGAVASAGVEYQISEEQKQLQERHERAKQELLRKRRASALAVPTNDNAVRARLRRLGEPMTLFGEREMERRDRLRMILANLDPAQQESLVKSHEDDEAANADDSDFEQEIEYPFFTEATRPKALREARGSDEDEETKKAGRLWGEDDEIAILEGMIEFKAKNGTDPSSNMGAFHEFSRRSLKADVNKNELRSGFYSILVP
ncbi:hypothetical protein ACLB2K_075998 [Fragaria x ananassa]